MIGSRKREFAALKIPAAPEPPTVTALFCREKHAGDVCAICLLPFEGKHATTECGHCFHTLCVELWYKDGAESCPTCRHEVKRRVVEVT